MEEKIKKCPECGQYVYKEFHLPPPNCPRCPSHDIRRIKKNHLYCRTCGYEAHFRQFYEGQRERIEVQKLFKKGILEGKDYIDWQKLEEEEGKRRKIKQSK